MTDVAAARSGRSVRVFEYGSGASTFWLADRATEVHSVEHHRGFGEMMARRAGADLRHVTLRIVEPVASAQPAVPSAKEGHEGLDFAATCASIDEVPGEFDLVVVDGRAREACLAAARAARRRRHHRLRQQPAAALPPRDPGGGLVEAAATAG